MESKDFRDAIKTIQEEPIPYFGMLTSEISNDSMSPVEEVKLDTETGGIERENTPRSDADSHKSVMEKEEEGRSEDEEIGREEVVCCFYSFCSIVASSIFRNSKF